MTGAILIVDDHPLYRDALLQVLGAEFPAMAMLSAASAAHGLQQAESTPDLRLIVLDLGLPGLSGIEAVKAFRRGCAGAALVVVSASDERREVAATFAAGARAFVSKSTPANALIDVLRRVLAGAALAPEWLTPSGARSDWQDTLPGLTRRQQEILVLLCEGHSNKEIGLRSGLAEITVKMHVSALFRILGVTNRTQAAVAARHAGLHGAAGATPAARS